MTLQPDADDAMCAEQSRLLLQTPERQGTGLVLGVAQRDHLHALICRLELPADVVDRAAHDLPERTDAVRGRQHELVHAQIAGEELRAIMERLQAVFGVQRQAALLQPRPTAGPGAPAALCLPASGVRTVTCG